MFIIPMAGSSQRFRDAGFTQPKYMLRAHGHTLFTHAVRSFARYFSTHPFLFVTRADHGSRSFLEDEIARLGVRTAEIVELGGPTAGQADTVRQGISHMKTSWTGPLGIFNIDTFRRNFRLPDYAVIPSSDYGGYLEVFRGTGKSWSFVRASSDGRSALEVREKLPISDLCSTGFYHFASVDRFLSAAYAIRDPMSESEAREAYVAPFYNTLIADGDTVRVDHIPIEDVFFCGIPDEYQSFLDSTWSNKPER